MYRYQRSPAEYGDTTWACNATCFRQTRWRIHPRDLGLVPIEDVPSVDWRPLVEAAAAAAAPAAHARRFAFPRVNVVAAGLASLWICLGFLRLRNTS